MTALGEGTRDTRRRAAIDEMVVAGQSEADVRKVLEIFAEPDRRLLTLAADKDGRTVAEVAHEALFEHWPELRQWLDQDRDDIRFAPTPATRTLPRDWTQPARRTRPRPPAGCPQSELLRGLPPAPDSRSTRRGRCSFCRRLPRALLRGRRERGQQQRAAERGARQPTGVRQRQSGCCSRPPAAARRRAAAMHQRHPARARSPPQRHGPADRPYVVEAEAALYRRCCTTRGGAARPRGRQVGGVQPGRAQVVTASDDRTARLWDAASGRSWRCCKATRGRSGRRRSARTGRGW